MPDIYLIELNITNVCLAYKAAPSGLQYYFEANIFSWGLLHV